MTTYEQSAIIGMWRMGNSVGIIALALKYEIKQVDTVVKAHKTKIRFQETMQKITPQWMQN